MPAPRAKVAAMLAGLIVFVAVVGVYIDALGGPFLWDDRKLILKADLLDRAAGFGEYLRHPFWASSGAEPAMVTYYRPLVSWSFSLDHRLHGNNPGGYHLTNLALHVSCALLLLALLQKQGARSSVATALAIGWAVLPRLAESAAWISGRTDVVASTFALASLLAWGRSPFRRTLASLLLGGGLLAKESALAVLPAIAVSEWLAMASEARVKRVGERLLLPIIVTLAYVALRLWAVGYRDEAVDLGVLGRTRTVLETVGTYTLSLLDAWRPRAVIGRQGVFSLAHLVLGSVVLASTMYLLWRKRSGIDPRVASGLTLGAGALLPVLHLVPIPLRTLAADRFLYLPTAALALAIAPALDAWLGRRRAAWGAALAVLASLAITTTLRVRVWSDEIGFWVQTYLETPQTNNAAAIELLGVYYRAGLYADALEIANRAMRYDDPHRGDARYNAALCLSRLGRREEALKLIQSNRWARHKQGEVAEQIAILEAQLGHIEVARHDLGLLARAGQPGAEWLLDALPRLERALAETARLGPEAEPEALARLANVIADDPMATKYWGVVARSPTASRAALHDAIVYLVQTGARASILAAVQNYSSRYGALERELAGMVDVRLAELERLIVARTRLGLR